MRKEIIALASVLLMLVVGFAFVDIIQDSDAVEDGASTYHVVFTTDQNRSNDSANGSKEKPFYIISTPNDSNKNKIPDGIQSGSILIVDGIDDVANVSNPSATNEAPRGHYDINIDMTLIAGDAIKDKLWNTSFHIHSNATLTLEGFHFGELNIGPYPTVNGKVIIDGCRFTLDEDSVNYTSNVGTSERKTARFNIKGGPNADITVRGCEFINDIDDGIHKATAIYSYVSAKEMTVSDSTFKGYDRCLQLVNVMDLDVHNNRFLDVRQFAEGDEGHVIRLFGNMNKASISDNMATSADVSSNVFLKISSGCEISDAISLSGNEMTDFGYGVRYTPNEDGSNYSEAKVNADGNMFVKDGKESMMDVDTGGRDGMVIETNPVISPSKPSIDDEDDELPFIPGQNVPQTSSGSDDRTTLVAAAAAVVVIMLAVVALMVTRNH